MEKFIINFKEEINNFTVEQLENKRKELQNEIAKMIFDSELVVKIAIIENRLQELENK